MNITEKQLDKNNLRLSLTVEAGDYAEEKKKALAGYRRRADIKGFRKGMVPASLIEKLFGEKALVDAVNDAISASLGKYIEEHKLNVIGEPLPSEDRVENEWKDGNTFHFDFDLATVPEVKVEVSASDELPLYNITITKEAEKEMADNLLQQYGSLQDTGKAGAEDYLTGVLSCEGREVEDAYISLRSVAEAEKNNFIGLAVGDEKVIDVNKAFVNETDRAALLKVKKEELAEVPVEWTLKVTSVRTFAPAKAEPATFDMIFGEGVVKDEAGFAEKVRERLAAEYARESDFRLQKDVKDFLIKKAGKFDVPEAFLKRWITLANAEKFKPEDIEREWPSFIEDYRWQIVRDSAMKALKVEVSEDELLASAKGFAAYQYAMYGMTPSDEQLTSFARRIIEQDSSRVREQVSLEKLTAAVRGVVTLKNKKISVEKFRAL